MTSLTRRQWLRASLGAVTACAATAQARKPNIVFILTDDQGWWDLGLHGNKDIETPVMDKLASESVELTRFYASPVCSPTRSSLMTGRHYLRTGIYNTRFGGDSLHLDETTIAEVLHKQGYRTGIFGKWHLGGYQPYLPHHRGFDEALTFTHGHTERYFYPDALSHNGRKTDARGYITNIFTDSAIAFLRENKSRPFFLYLAYNVPHEPHIVDDKHLDKFLKKGVPLREARIMALVSVCDENIGRVLSAIDAEGLRDDTVVIFSSDNGGISKHYKAGLRGNKASAYEGGVRVPFFARWPGHFPAGAKSDAMAAHIDFFPTMCELTGAPAGKNIDGKSILPLLLKGGGESPHDYLFHIWDRLRPSMKSNWAISGKRYKLVRNELFDLEKDPGETTDIAASHPEIVKDLRERFAGWLKDVTQGQTFQPVAIEVGRADENPVEIQTSWALIDGTQSTSLYTSATPFVAPQPLGAPNPESTVNYTFSAYDWDTIDSWRKPGELARWKIEVVAAGRYEVALNYGCDPGSAGGKFRISAGGASLDCVVAATPQRDVFERRVMGVLTMAKGATSLEVKVLSTPGHELMALNKIWLRKV